MNGHCAFHINLTKHEWIQENESRIVRHKRWTILETRNTKFGVWVSFCLICFSQPQNWPPSKSFCGRAYSQFEKENKWWSWHPHEQNDKYDLEICKFHSEDLVSGWITSPLQWPVHLLPLLYNSLSADVYAAERRNVGRITASHSLDESWLKDRASFPSQRLSFVKN